jgi:hypothetical protein
MNDAVASDTRIPRRGGCKPRIILSSILIIRIEIYVKSVVGRVANVCGERFVLHERL